MLPSDSFWNRGGRAYFNAQDKLPSPTVLCSQRYLTADNFASHTTANARVRCVCCRF